MSEIDSTAIPETFFQHRTFEKSTNKESTLEKLREKPKSADGFGKKPKTIVDDGDTTDEQSSYKSKANHVTDQSSEEILFTCEICNKSFTHKVSLSRHKKAHLDFKPFKCSFCEKTFSRKTYLEDHIHAHTWSRPYQWQFCEKKRGTHKW